MISSIETLILKGLYYEEDYTRKVLPYVKDEYFETTIGRTYFKLCKEHFSKYNQCPNRDSIQVAIEQLEGITEEEFQGNSTRPS